MQKNRRGELTLKNEKGITLIVLLISIVIMLILVTAAINYGTNSAKEVQLQSFSYELQQIQGRVDSIYEKMKMENNSNFMQLNGVYLGSNVGMSSAALDTLAKKKEIDYRTADQNDKNIYPVSGYSIWRYFSKNNLEEYLDVKNASMDVLINFKTREVISVQGFLYDEKNYYMLSDFK